MERLKGRLTGLRLTGGHAPSQSSIDKWLEIYESNTLKYLPWSVHTTRDQEVNGDKEVEVFKKQKDGVLKAFKEQAEGAAPMGSELALRKLLVRRAVAMDVAGIASFEALDEWSEQLFEAMEEEPLSGYAPVSAEQVEDADKKLFSEIAKKTEMGIKP